MSPRLTTYLQTSPELRRLSGEADRLLSLQHRYEKLAPASLVRSSRVMQLEQGTLSIAADNGAVAAKLRQLAPDLVRQFRDDGCEVSEIRVRVQVSVPPRRRRSSVIPLSDAGRERMLKTLEGLHDSPLKSALRQLAEAAAKKT
ncbi:MAG: DUF721 domain-containing protein [Gallionellaceae bacterium]|jgi:hypothetical protein|nr:DUF721 domain-containing protein [Gallionellaceae bacterium]